MNLQKFIVTSLAISSFALFTVARTSGFRKEIGVLQDTVKSKTVTSKTGTGTQMTKEESKTTKKTTKKSYKYIKTTGGSNL